MPGATRLSHCSLYSGLSITHARRPPLPSFRCVYTRRERQVRASIPPPPRAARTPPPPPPTPPPPPPRARYIIDVRPACKRGGRARRCHSIRSRFFDQGTARTGKGREEGLSAASSGIRMGKKNYGGCIKREMM